MLIYAIIFAATATDRDIYRCCHMCRSRGDALLLFAIFDID